MQVTLWSFFKRLVKGDVSHELLKIIPPILSKSSHMVFGFNIVVRADKTKVHGNIGVNGVYGMQRDIKWST